MNCDNCCKLKFISDKNNSNPKLYLECLNYVKDLVQSGYFQQRDDISPYCKTTDLSDTKRAGGWNYDLMQHRIECNRCGRIYELFADTYHGSWRFAKADSKAET